MLAEQRSGCKWQWEGKVERAVGNLAPPEVYQEAIFFKKVYVGAWRT